MVWVSGAITSFSFGPHLERFDALLCCGLKTDLRVASAMLRSQEISMLGLAFMCCPTAFHSPPPSFWLPLPPSRRPWPPPCSVRDSRGFGTSRLGLGERGSTRVLRGRRTRPSERFRLGHGPSRFQPAGRRRLDVVVDGLPALAWRTAGHRHHNGPPSETRRHSAGRHSHDKWEGFGRRQKSESQKIP